MPIDYKAVQPGYVLVKEFFIVAMVPDGMSGFFICGDVEDQYTAVGLPDALAPCITTERARAEKWYARAVQKASGQHDGKVVLIRFTNGTVETMAECRDPDAKSLDA